MGYGRGKLAHFRQGKLAHSFSMNKSFRKSIQYFVAFSDYISQILSPKQDFAAKKRIQGHRNIYICKSYYISHSMEFCMWANLPRHVGPCLPPLQKLQCEKYGYFMFFLAET